MLMANGKKIKETSYMLQMPISLEQLALAIEQLSEDELEELELSFDSEMAAEIRERQRSLPALDQAGKLLSLEDF